MKKWILLLSLNAIVGIAFAQNFEQPKEGAKIYLSAYEVSLNPTGETKVDLWVVRSKKARKSKFDTPKFLGGEDLDIQINQDANDPNHYVATIKTTDLENGKYFYTVSSRSRSVQKVKGTTITFNVGAGTTVTKNN